MTVLPVLVFVSGPYRDPRGPYFIAENIRRASEVGLALWQRGVPAIVPHRNTAMWDGAAPDEVWLAGDLVMLARCDAVVLVPGWRRSAGTRAEFEFALERGIPVFEAGSAELELWIAAASSEADERAVSGTEARDE